MARELHTVNYSQPDHRLQWTTLKQSLTQPVVPSVIFHATSESPPPPPLRHTHTRTHARTHAHTHTCTQTPHAHRLLEIRTEFVIVGKSRSKQNVYNKLMKKKKYAEFVYLRTDTELIPTHDNQWKHYSNHSVMPQEEQASRQETTVCPHWVCKTKEQRTTITTYTIPAEIAVNWLKPNQTLGETMRCTRWKLPSMICEKARSAVKF